MNGQPITGRARRRTTTRAVKLAERLSRVFITLGGLGTIVAVGTIFVFLLSVVFPLFRDARLSDAGRVTVAAVPAPVLPRHVALDDYGSSAWALLPGGEVVAFALADGAELERRQLFEGRQPTAFHASTHDSTVAFGFEDGSVQLGRIGFASRFLEPGDPAAAAPELASLQPGTWRHLGAGLVQRTPEGQLRVQELSVVLDEPLRSGSASPVLLLAHSAAESRSVLTVLKADGSLVREEVSRRTNLLTGKVTSKVQDVALPLQPRLGHAAPSHLLQSDLADSIYVAWDDGYTERFDVRDVAAPKLAETLQLLPGSERRLTALTLLLGSTTLVAGDSGGGVSGWFLARPEDAARDGGLRLVRAHELPARDSAVTSLAASARNRLLAAGYADGDVRLLHMTSERVLAEIPAQAAPSPTSASAEDADLGADRGTVHISAGGSAGSGSGGPGSAALVVLSPRADGLLALGAGEVRRWSVHADSPETTFSALFRPVWYEGAAAPAHVWQSSSGTDDFEPKFGLWPLVFGTLKASLYSLLFAVPIALLAAIYTSEFLSRPMRTRIKPVIEIMASLPSVVLGFLAAIVFAPLVEHIVPQVLAALVLVPLAFVVGAHLWQLLPQGVALRLAGLPRFGAMILAVFAGIALAAASGGALERGFFAGDIMGWLDGRKGSSVGGWLLLTVPAAVLAVVVVRARLLAGWTRRISRGWSRERTAGFGLLLLLGSLLGVAALALGCAQLLDGAGFDPRGSFVDTYVQRNALVVGFLTGFAVIPIMYTLAEDALASVPDHLRAASLAAGATPWQTAVRVVVPTAMSGIFSAVMIGIGRVIGETMIVLMAAGNTPVLDWNIFNGFRTLSATIAVELPEAVQGGTLYRVLFLAALTLFAMTFVLNTIAELVRQRFRKRAYEL